jgi:prevent-host-death family protein
MPDRVTIHAAKTHLSALVARAEAGEEIIIARGNTPVAKLVPLHPPAPVKRRTFGCLSHLGSVGDEALDGWTEEELTEWEEGHPGDPLRSP